MTTKKSRDNICSKAILPKIGSMLAGVKAAKPAEKSGITLNICCAGSGT